ncbi:MAG: hypothetical protein ABI551_15050 [Polyangiaceae bacterium]
MKIFTVSFLAVATWLALGCQADVGPYVVSVERGPTEGSIKVVKCKTSVTNMGDLTAYENNGDCSEEIVQVMDLPPRPRSAAAPRPAPAASATASPPSI